MSCASNVLECATFESVLLGARGVLVNGAKSAFHTEVAALDLATEWLTNTKR